MKRSQSTIVILATFMLAAILTGFKVKPSIQNNFSEVEELIFDQVNPNFLIGKWVKMNDPETTITFKADNTVTEKSGETSTEKKWTVNKKKREVCIGNAKCIYYEATEQMLFLFIDKKRVAYKKVTEN